MHEPTSPRHAAPVPPGTPGEDETLARMAFQAAHPEVGFRHLGGYGEPWIAYWLAADGRRRWVTGVTLGAVLGRLDAEFS